MADIVICVHNALPEVRACLSSLERHTDPRHSVILVDDGSDQACHDELAAFARARSGTVLIRNERARGYTASANQGLRCSSAPFVVLLNSDTVLTSNWLERLIECAVSHPDIGIVGPLSNAGGYQSVPRAYRRGGFAENRLPADWSPDRLASLVAAISTRAFPRLELINGFCFGITRPVIESIGYFDERRFPVAYCEENDYCFRARAAGFELAIADHAYVYHAKSRSYARRRRRALSRRGQSALRRGYGRAYLTRVHQQCQAEPTLVAMRRQLQELLPGVSDRRALLARRVGLHLVGAALARLRRGPRSRPARAATASTEPGIEPSR